MEKRPRFVLRTLAWLLSPGLPSWPSHLLLCVPVSWGQRLMAHILTCLAVAVALSQICTPILVPHF